jgi:hypothetical protein
VAIGDIALCATGYIICHVDHREKFNFHIATTFKAELLLPASPLRTLRNSPFWSVRLHVSCNSKEKQKIKIFLNMFNQLTFLVETAFVYLEVGNGFLAYFSYFETRSSGKN